MPYRRLPNTDVARINALEVVVGIKHAGFQDIALTQDLLNAADRQLIVLKNVHYLHRQAVKTWQENNQKYREIIKYLTSYITDFVKSYNLAIENGYIKPETRAYYKITDDALPEFISEDSILDWGQRLIDGERQRIFEGGAPITNPTIASINVYYEKFTDLNFNQKTKLNYIQHTKSKLAQEREKSDILIKELWNKIEATFAYLPENERIEKCKEYGIIYYMRSYEKQQQEMELPIEYSHNELIATDTNNQTAYPFYDKVVEKIEKVKKVEKTIQKNSGVSAKYQNALEQRIPFDFD